MKETTINSLKTFKLFYSISTTNLETNFTNFLTKTLHKKCPYLELF